MLKHRILAPANALLLSASVAWPICCPKLDFTEGVEDWQGLRESCHELKATSATKVSLGALSIYKISPDEYVFVHDAMGCLDTILRAEVLFLSNAGADTERGVLLTSSANANISISWNSEELVFYYTAIEPLRD